MFPNTDSSDHHEVPLLGLVNAGRDCVLFAEAQGPFDMVEAPQEATSNTVAVEVRGTSLGPIFDGWIIFYDNLRRHVSRDLLGKLCVVGDTQGHVMVKRLAKGQLPDRFNLLSNTEPPIYDAQLEWAAPVLAMRPKGRLE